MPNMILWALAWYQAWWGKPPCLIPRQILESPQYDWDATNGCCTDVYLLRLGR